MLGSEGTINLPFKSSLVEFASQKFLPLWLALTLALAAPAIYAFSACAATRAAPRPGCRRRR